jgi:hypothetical protein
MCEKRAELDLKLAKYRRMVFSITDQLTIDRLNALISETLAEKARLHPPSAGRSC